MNRRSLAVRVAAALAAALLAALAVDTCRWMYQRWQAEQTIGKVFAALLAGGRRPLEVRLSHPLADRHRPPGGNCDEHRRSLLQDHRSLMAFEERDDRRGLAAVHALACDRKRASSLLRSLPMTPERESDLAALRISEGEVSGEALTRLDRLLRNDPGHPQATWNRALLLQALQLPLSAARGFRNVAARGEPGWAAEASDRARRLEDDWQAVVRRDAEARQAVEGIGRGSVPEAKALRRFPELARTRYYEALRAHPSDAWSTLLPVATAIDSAQGGRSLQALARGEVSVTRLDHLGKKPIELANAEEYQRLVAAIGDPWLEIQGWQLLARAHADRRDLAAAEAAFGKAFGLCERRSFPQLCAQTKLWLARYSSDRYKLQQARRLALEAKNDSVVHGLPVSNLKANVQLQRLESFRKEIGLARAYAEELSLRTDACETTQLAREWLAELALQEQDVAEARRQVATVQVCPGASAPRFSLVGLSVLGELIRDPAAAGPERQWFTESLARQADLQKDRGPLDRGYLLLFEGRASILRDPKRAEGLLEQVALRAEAAGAKDEAAETQRMQALSTLIVGASARGEHGRALAFLARALRVPEPGRCVVGAAAQSAERAYLARGPDGAVIGVHAGGLRPARPVEGLVAAERPLPVEIIRAVQRCEQVDVMATPPFLGRARLLPDHLSWGYLWRGAGAPPPNGFERLVVEEVEAPASFNLPPLSASAPTPRVPGERLVRLRGAQATGREVVRGMLSADLIELHVHGVMEPTISDAPSLVLAPDETGRALLTAGDIERLRLDRQPGVILGACEAANSARYWSFEHSLPAAFLKAGARWAIASPAPVEDGEAGPFFQQVWSRIRAGTPVATAVRDERTSPRWRDSSNGWVHDVVAFY